MTTTASREHDIEIAVPQSVPHLEQYFGVWLMHGPTFTGIIDHVNGMDLDRHIRMGLEETRSALRPQSEQGGRRFEMLGDDLAMIELAGTMTKYGSSLSQMRRGTIGVRQAVRAALADTQVQGILLRVDSPGGAVAGVDDLAADLFKAAKQKPVHAYIEDMGASGAYYVASQATKIVANPPAVVGSIGTYAVLYDVSEMAKAEGIKVHVIRAGEFKGAGVPGTKITPEQLAEFQRSIDQINELFVGAVARGRKIGVAEAQKLNDGAVHIGEHAKALGLVDAVQGFDEAVAELRSVAGSGRSVRGVGRVTHTTKETMMNGDNGNPPAQTEAPPNEGAAATPTQAAKPATYSELKMALPNAPAEFLVTCLEQSMSLPAAQLRYTELLEARADAAEEKATQAAAEAKTPGVDALGGAGTASAGSAGDGNGDPIAAWETALAEKMKTPMTKATATRTLVAKNPELHEAYIAAYNEKHPPHDDIKKG